MSCNIVILINFLGHFRTDILGRSPLAYVKIVSVGFGRPLSCASVHSSRFSFWFVLKVLLLRKTQVVKIKSLDRCVPDTLTFAIDSY